MGRLHEVLGTVETVHTGAAGARNAALLVAHGVLQARQAAFTKLVSEEPAPQAPAFCFSAPAQAVAAGSRRRRKAPVSANN